MSHKIGTILGPSAAGKDTVLLELSKMPDLHRIVNDTTRAPRPGEINGREYYFVNDSDYKTNVNDNLYFTVNAEKGRKYGVRQTELETAWQNSQTPIGHFGMQDHENIWRLSEKGRFIAKSVFLSVPDFSTWISRMEKRIEDKFISESEMLLRSQEAAKEYAFLAENIGRFAVILSIENEFSSTVETCRNYIQHDDKPLLSISDLYNLVNDFTKFKP